MLPFLGILAPIISKVVGTAGNVIDQLVEDKDKAKEIKAELTLQAMNIDHSEFETHLKESSKIIQGEINSQSWLARNWRPMLMCLFGLIILNNYILFPYLSLFTTKTVMLEIPPDMWNLLKIGVGGYVVGRSAEKGIRMWKEK